MKKFFADFKKFISRGNIIDMAVGVIIGSAFSAIVTALTNKIIMPFINLLLSIGGENGLESAITVLKPAYLESGELDLAKSIYIDWGAFITAIINFLLIALVLFLILKAVMKASSMIHDTVALAKKGKLTKEEKAELKAQGISLKDKEAVAAYREEKARRAAEAKAEEEAKAKAAEEEKYHNSTEYLLKEILACLKEKEAPKKELAKAVKKATTK